MVGLIWFRLVYDRRLFFNPRFVARIYARIMVFFLPF